jgi:hypothetical protein
VSLSLHAYNISVYVTCCRISVILKQKLGYFLLTLELALAHNYNLNVHFSFVLRIKILGLKTLSVQNKADEYRQNCVNHVDRIRDARTLKHIPESIRKGSHEGV